MERKITLKDFQKIKDKTKRNNEIKKVYGIAGTGKTTYMANLIKEKIKQKEGLRILILSYSHSGKNELFKKLTGKELGKVNKKDDVEFIEGHKVYLSAMTFFSFIKKVLEESNINNNLKEYLSNFLENRIYYVKTKKFKEFIEKNNLKIRFNFLLSLLEILANSQSSLDKYYSKLIEESIIQKKIILNDDESDILVLFLENNIFQHTNTKVYDYIHNRQYPLMFLLGWKWSSLLKRNIEIDRILELRKMIINEYPYFNLNSFLVYLNKIIEEKGLLNILKQEYDIVIIDEAQDTPDYFLKFLFQVLDTDELYLVGDPAQNIYFDLGYSETFTKFDKDAIILKNIYRYSEELKYFILRKYPNFQLLWKTKSKVNYKTEILKISKKEISHFLDVPYIIIKNTNKPFKIENDVITYMLHYKTSDTILQWFGILENINFFVKRGMNNKLLKKWIFMVPKTMNLDLQHEVLNRLKNIEYKEKVLFLLDLITENSQQKDFVNFIKNFNELKKLIRLPKYKIKDHNYLFYYSLFNNTYQSKGRSYKRVIYYNEFGKYYLMKKHLEDNVFWKFYHATLEYVAYTRAMKKLYIVEK